MSIAMIRLEEFKKEASSTEKTIIEYMLKNLDKTTKLTIYELSEKTYTSPSSIIRLCKKIGYTGYREFIKELIHEQAILNNEKSKIISNFDENDGIEEILKKVTFQNINSLEETYKFLDSNVIKNCVERIYDCDHLYIFGMGASQIVAKDAQLKFSRVNKRSFVSEDWHSQLINAKNINEKDVAIMISYSGETREMIKCAEDVKRNGAILISITQLPSNPISRIADYAIYISSNEYDFRSGAMSSRIAQLNIIDILYTGYLSQKYEDTVKILKRNQIEK